MSELGLLARTIWNYLQLGLGLSLIAYPILQVSNEIFRKIGGEPLPQETFQKPFDTFCNCLFHPIEQGVDDSGQSIWRSEMALKGAVAVTVVSFAVILEVVSLTTVAGISIAGAHLIGWEVEFATLGYKIVAIVVLLIIALMDARYDRINQKIKIS
ncbi:hypothetical protein [Halorarum salinum]|uniref:Uncharacterized protein n=1 Tax=Halorarum salinum TaxID=2743089 RepID=A0A7D5QAF0_9EURY|nr:hypothetical protein [Halobaculum salinum]QLG60920.1 hypothetical protein HUG12_03860 [Halobaculum salinum]